MKIILDVKDSKAGFFMELLKNFPYVKVQLLTPQKAEILKDLKEAVENVNRVKRGAIKARPAKDLPDEL